MNLICCPIIIAVVSSSIARQKKSNKLKSSSEDVGFQSIASNSKLGKLQNKDDDEIRGSTPRAKLTTMPDMNSSSLFLHTSGFEKSNLFSMLSQIHVVDVNASRVWNPATGGVSKNETLEWIQIFNKKTNLDTRQKDVQNNSATEPTPEISRHYNINSSNDGVNSDKKYLKRPNSKMKMLNPKNGTVDESVILHSSEGEAPMFHPYVLYAIYGYGAAFSCFFGFYLVMIPIEWLFV